MKTKIDSIAFRQIMGSFATGVAVAATHDKTLGPVGLTINSLTSVSLDPALVLFCLEKTAFLHKAFLRADFFTVSFLAQDQENVSRHFADRHHNAKPKNIWDRKERQAPTLRGTLGWVLCRPFKFYKGGDHTIIVGEVMQIKKATGLKEPLIYYHGRYRDLAAAKVTSGARK